MRLLPEDRFDTGPAVEKDGNFALVADVRLDNREELARTLNLSKEQLGHLSDTSLLLKCLIAWGEGALDRLDGDFAFAFWDGNKAQLMLARDYCGQRPLHYASGKGFFALASMPCGIHALEVVDRIPSSTAAISFLHHRPLPPETSFFDNVSQVPPGHLLTLRNEQVSVRRWWRFSPSKQPRRSLDECAEQARELLDSAVAARLRGSGSIVAAHLSAGLDSSGVAATAARMLGETGLDLLAFTAVPHVIPGNVHRDTIADESQLAGLVIKPFGNVEHLTIVGEGSLKAAFNRNVQLWERPVPNIINDLWWSAITRSAAGRGASVLLTAPMGNLGLSHSGDEIFAELLASFRWFELARALASARRVRGSRANTLALSMLVPLLPRPLWDAVQTARGRRATPHFLAAGVGAEDAGAAHDFDRAPRSSLQRRLDILEITDPGVFNVGAAAGWGVDMRDALADKKLMEFALALPTEMFFDRGESRALARRALSDRLPEPVLRENRKGYQSADWHVLLLQNRAEMMAEAEAIKSSSAGDVIDSAALIEALHLMPKQDWSSARTRHVYGSALVGALSAGHFLRSTRV